MDNIESKGIGNSTKEGVKNLLMPIFKREFELQNIDRNPLKLVKTNYKREKTFLNSTQDELKEIVKKVYQGITTQSHGGVNTEVLFLLSLLTGRRIGELTQLKYTDINFETKRIKVRAETTKTRKDNTHLYQYPVPEVVIELLIHNKDLDEKIFPSHKDTYIRNYKVMIQKIKLGTDYKVSSHTNRKFFISLCTKFNTDFVNEVVLSHTSNEMKSVYLTYNNEDIQELYEYYSDIIK
ncbi:tyrosine-type recombinase/integrase [Candidatus Sulfurimonas marisnigri]|uniref:Tyrosine-type recombinase/integrase n=1 Tax=Candidatus Sulfurimonas marisnigri TaxID=2740405 RepID=A0A7S7M1X0_9BACT|nr:tyrosine-type recombinase/integrase [Candidatus Sulfurimonas marisnigri]QOY55415.1 tyrosine-type recombinase/integrase [Candidatus Sulfurimonas marisnigri]